SGGDGPGDGSLRLAGVALVRLRLLDAPALRPAVAHLQPPLRARAGPDVPPGGPRPAALPSRAGLPRPSRAARSGAAPLSRLLLADRGLDRRGPSAAGREAPGKRGGGDRSLDGTGPADLDAGARGPLLPLLLSRLPLLPGALGALPRPLRRCLRPRPRAARALGEALRGRRGGARSLPHVLGLPRVAQ